MIDNTTAESIIDHIGTSHSHTLNKLVKDNWLWCIERNRWLSAARIPCVDKTEADLMVLQQYRVVPLSGDL